MMIIGKYFETNNEFINVMKTGKRYKQLTAMYHFKPISDTTLFDNMETQYFYRQNDKKRAGMYRYIYFCTQNYNRIPNKQENEIFKRLILHERHIKHNNCCIEIENGHCHIPEGVTTIGQSIFESCTTITSIELPTTLHRICNNSFRATHISTLTIPEGV